MSPELISAGVSLGSGLLNAITNNIAQRRAIREQNAYNTPTEQMRRYQAAGLSPNLIYGSGSGSSGNQTSLGDYQGVKTSTQDAVNMANAILSMRNLVANTRKAEAEAKTAESVSTKTDLDIEQQRTFLQQYQERLQADLDLAKINMQYRSGLINLQTYQRLAQLAQIRHLNTQSAINDWQLKEGLPATLAISQQNANTAEQNMILGFKKFAFDSSFDEDVNPLNFWNAALKRREYHWEPINDITRGLGTFLGGGIVGTILRGKGMQGPKSGGSRGPTYYNSRNYQSVPDYGFYD